MTINDRDSVPNFETCQPVAGKPCNPASPASYPPLIRSHAIMIKNASFHAFVATALAFCSSALSAQEPKPLPSLGDEVFDVPGSFAIVRRLDNFTSDLTELVHDIRLQPMLLNDCEEIMEYAKETGIATDRPIVRYWLSDLSNEFSQIPFINAETIKRHAIAPENINSWKEPFKLSESLENINWLVQTVEANKEDDAIISGSTLLVQPKNFDQAPKPIDFSAFSKSKKIKTSLDPRTLQMLDRSGIAAHIKRDGNEESLNNLHWLFPFLSADFPNEKSPVNLSEREKQIARTIVGAAQRATNATGTLKYSDRRFSNEADLTFDNATMLKELIDFESAAKPYQPTVGMPANGLLVSASVNSQVFASPDTARLLLRMFPLWTGWSEQRTFNAWNSGKLFELSGGLIVDAWHDLKAARGGLYHSSQTPGTFSLIAIFDPKDPDAFFAQVEKLVALIEPIGEEGISDAARAEIQSLIKQLDDDRYSIRERAQTRLMLAGDAAVPVLKSIDSSSVSAEMKIRIRQILQRQKPKPDPETMTSDVAFWANLRPQIAIENQQNEFEGHAARLLRILPDPKHSETQIAAASATTKRLFGPNWNKIWLVQHDKQFILMFGSDEQRLKQTIRNLDTGADPIRKVALEKSPWFENGHLQLHASTQRLAATFLGKDDQYYLKLLQEKIVERGEGKEVLSSASLKFDKDYWQWGLIAPVEEVLPAFQFFSN